MYGDADETALLHRASVCYDIGHVYELKGDPASLDLALAWCEKGLASLPATPTAAAALLHTLSGTISLHRGNFAHADAEGRRAVDLAKAAGAQAELGLAHRLLSITSRAQGRLGEALDHCRSDIEIRQALSDLSGLAKNYINQGVIAFEMDDWSLARESYTQAVATLERVGDLFQLGRAYINLADLYCHLGEIEPGIVRAQQAVDICTRVGSQPGMIVARAVLATLLWRQGELADALAHLLQARELTGTDALFKPTIGQWLAQVYLSAGDVASAEAEIQALLGMDEDVLADDAEPIQRLWGQILAAQGKSPEAVQVLEASLARLEQAQMRYQAGRTRLALAGVLTHIKDRTVEAQTHATHARAVFSDLGATLDVREADELLMT